MHEVAKIGPLGESEGIDSETLKLKLTAVNQLVPYIKLVERERLRVPLKTEKDYHAFFASDEANRLFNELILDKLAVSQIMLLLRDKSLSTAEMAEILDLNPSEVSKHMNSSSRQGFVRYDESQKRYAIA